MTGDIQDWWDKTSGAYQDACEIPVDIHYDPSSPNEDELKLLGERSAAPRSPASTAPKGSSPSPANWRPSTASR